MSLISNPAPNFVGLTDFARFTTEGAAQVSPEVTPAQPFDQLIVSWNVSAPLGSSVRVEARTIFADHTSKWYSLGDWTPDALRTSVPNQKDADGDVSTDTLVLTRLALRAQVRVTLVGGASPKYIGLSFLNSHTPFTERAPNKAAWGTTLAVPCLCQLSYPGGKVWCSPTSVAMVMDYWAEKEKRDEWRYPVPATAQAVYDTEYKGTGNWPFNTAFAGSHQGLKAYITRLPDIRALEESLTQGIPVICSVSYNAAEGDDSPGSSGHILICVGFTKDGDVVVNDPWAHLDKGQSVRKVFQRERFLHAWADSHHTVYLIYPEHKETPSR